MQPAARHPAGDGAGGDHSKACGMPPPSAAWRFRSCRDFLRAVLMKILLGLQGIAVQAGISRACRV